MNGIAWQVKITGNMTMAILDERGVQVLRVDMLKHGTMLAGTDGERLIQAMNDLTVLACLPGLLAGSPIGALPDPELGITPGTWRLSIDDPRQLVTVKTARGILATRKFSAAQRAPYVRIRDILLRAPLVLSHVEVSYITK